MGAHELHACPDLVWGHVVAHDKRRPGIKGLGHLTGVLTLDLDHATRPPRQSLSDRLADREPAEVVVLDQHPLGEAASMIGRSACPHGRLLERPQSRCGLARVPDPRRRVGSVGGLDVAPRRRCHTREMTEEVERCPLGGEQGPQRALEPSDHATWPDIATVPH